MAPRVVPEAEAADGQSWTRGEVASAVLMVVYVVAVSVLLRRLRTGGQGGAWS